MSFQRHVPAGYESATECRLSIDCMDSQTGFMFVRQSTPEMRKEPRLLSGLSAGLLI